MGDTKVEEDHATGREFDWDGLLFRDFATDVMIAKGIAAVIEGGLVTPGDHVDGAVFDCGIVEGDPHCRALCRVFDFEVRVVLMPVRPKAGLARLEENLVQIMDEGFTD